MLTSVATRSYILLAESDPNVLYTLTGILEQAGFKVLGVSGFEEARKSLRQREFDAVMTELGLEREGQGLDLAGQAKKLPSSPVVVICAANPTVERGPGCPAHRPVGRQVSNNRARHQGSRS